MEGKNKEEQKNKKGNRKIVTILVILAIVLIAIAVGVYAFFKYHGEQLEILTNEANVLSIMDIDENTTIDMTIKSKGDYAVIEQTMKDYINEVVQVVKQNETVFDTESIQSLMSAENLKNDAKDFTESKQKIATFRTNAEQYLDKAMSLVEENNILGAIDDKDVSDYYKELYKTLMLDSKTSEKLKESKTELESAKQQLLQTLDFFTELFNYLSDNKDSWTLVNGQIIFSTQEKLDGYMEIVGKMKDLNE